MPFFRFIVFGFVILVLLGGSLLMLPLSSASGTFTSPVSAFFTAVSAVSATGLVVVDTHDYWSLRGQLVILVLIQLGGLGFMIMSAFLLALLRQSVDIKDTRITDTVGVTAQRHIVGFAMMVIIVTLLIEALGGLFIFGQLRNMDAQNTVWRSAFYAISAFNNSGFDLQGDFRSMVDFQGHLSLLGTLAALFIVGGLGVPLVMELVARIPWSGWSLDAKLSIATTFWLLLLGSGLIFLAEVATTLPNLSTGDRALNAFFLSASTRTAGFSTMAVGSLTLQTLLFLMVLMFIGGVSGSTAGGIKVNTFATIFLTAVSYLRGHRNVHAFGRVIPEAQVHRAVAVMFLGVVFIFVFTILLTITDGLPFIQVIFEVISASTTTGLTTGITPDLSVAGKAILMLAMFIGRLGPLAAVLALTQRHGQKPEPAEPEEAIRIG